MNKLITNVSVAGIFSAPNFQSEMITQTLIWEELNIIEKKVESKFGVKLELEIKILGANAWLK